MHDQLWGIESKLRNAEFLTPQHVAFYALVTSSLKAADTLATACPADTALTPVAAWRRCTSALGLAGLVIIDGGFSTIRPSG
jgi:hypothetical protein